MGYRAGNYEKQAMIDFTKDGECSRCGSCCIRFLPVSASDQKNIKRYIEKNDIKPSVVFAVNRENAIDLTCPFHNKDTKVCNIYPVRPKICRTMLCSRPHKELEQEKVMYHKRWPEIDMWDLFTEE